MAKKDKNKNSEAEEVLENDGADIEESKDESKKSPSSKQATVEKEPKGTFRFLNKKSKK